MDFQNILLLLTSVANFILGIFIYFKNRKSTINRSFSAFIFFIACWQISIFLYRWTDNISLAIYFMKGAYVSALFIGASYYYFSYVFPENITPSSQFRILFLSITGVLFILLLLPDFLTKSIVFHSWGKETVLGMWEYFIFVAYFIYFFAGGLIRGWYKYKRLRGIAKVQALYVVGSVSTAGFFGMLFNLFLPSPFFQNFQFIWLGPLFTAIIVVSIAYAILRYRLMDIHVIEKNLVVYAGLVLYTFFAFYAGANIFLRYVGDLFAPQTIIFEILLTIFFVVTFIKISEQLTEVSEKKLFGSFFLYQQKLRDLSQTLTTVIDFDRLIDRLVQEIIAIMGLERVGVLLKQEEGADHYKIQKIIGFHEENGISLVKDNFLTRYLWETKKPLIYEELQLTIRDTLEEGKRGQLQDLSDNMKRIEAELCIPLFSKDILQGILVLGQKVSGEPYNQGELDLLETIASQASIAIENAKLYDQIQGLNQTLEAKVQDQTKALEEQNIKLKELLEIKSEFLHIVSHQLRTPLSTLRGFLQFWRSEEFKLFPVEEQKEMQEKIFTSTERLNALINDMLTAMDLEGGAFHFTFEQVELIEIIHEIYEELKENFAKKNIEFRMSGEGSLSCMADKRYLREALSNIIDNAEKYTLSGVVEVAIEKQGEYVIIKVSDTGVGLTEQDKMRLFGKFLRGERAESIFPNGTGLGLYIAKQIIDGHKGKIEVFSEGESKGTTVTITLPTIQ